MNKIKWNEIKWNETAKRQLYLPVPKLLLLYLEEEEEEEEEEPCSSQESSVHTFNWTLSSLQRSSTAVLLHAPEAPDNARIYGLNPAS